MSNRLIKTSFAVLWLMLAITAGVAWFRTGLALRDIPEQLDEWLSVFGIGRAATLYIILYTLRPLILFPASLLTIASGLIFGPWLGILFTIIGENASANFAFRIARWLGRSWIDEREQSRLKHWDQKISENAITSVLIMRLIYLPFDAVNYGCGLTSMSQRDYFLGTLLGIMPGLVSFVLFGGAGAAGVNNRLWVFGGACLFFVLGLVIARLLRRSEPKEGQSQS
ncbi:MAG: TVP38/TMEM64 family protein [Myxococcales bacterium]|jgi:uncharacterized membrane protein YdjX (TVP38/TMEM64 family)